MNDDERKLTRSREEREDDEKREMNAEEISAVVVDCAYHLHVDLGPGLLESVYETVLARMLIERGLRVERQKVIVFEYHGIRFDDGLRVDLMLNDQLIVELKSVETLAPVHGKQLLTYLRLLQLPLGLLINFGAATFKEGCKRIVNNHSDFASSREGDGGWHAKPRRTRRKTAMIAELKPYAEYKESGLPWLGQVLPYTPDAWIKDGATKIGYEVSFTRHFYQPQPLRTLEEISTEILAIEKEAEGLLDEIIGGAH